MIVSEKKCKWCGSIFITSRNNKVNCSLDCCIKTNRRNRQEKQREYYREWYAKNGRNRSGVVYDESIKRWRSSNPEKIYCHRIVRNGVRAKRIIAPKKCAICGKETKLCAHHVDYTKPLLVSWLCISCHRKVHNGLQHVKENNLTDYAPIAYN